MRHHNWNYEAWYTALVNLDILLLALKVFKRLFHDDRVCKFRTTKALCINYIYRLFNTFKLRSVNSDGLGRSTRFEHFALYFCVGFAIQNIYEFVTKSGLPASDIAEHYNIFSFGFNLCVQNLILQNFSDFNKIIDLFAGLQPCFNRRLRHEVLDVHFDINWRLLHFIKLITKVK